MGDKLLVTVHFKNESKKISVEKEKTVQEFIEQDIASRLDLQDIAYFSLAEEDVGGADRWLDHEETIGTQAGEHLHFKVKYWKHPKEIQDPVALTLFYYQIQQNVVSGSWWCTEAQSLKLAAHQVLVEFGNHVPFKHKPGFLDAVGLGLFLPPEYRPENNINAHYQQRIFNQHAVIPPLETRVEALHRYIEIAEQLPSYGLTLFKVKDEQSKDVYLATSEEAIYLFSYPDKEYVEQFLFSHLRGWVGKKDENDKYKGITIQKREEDKKKRDDYDSDDEDVEDENAKTTEVHFTTTHQQAETILDLLSGYALLLQTSLPKWRKATAMLTLETTPPGLPPSSLFTPPSTSSSTRVFPPKISSSVLLFKSVYFACCKKLGVQPLPKLCQLVDDATDRNSWLNKLDLSDGNEKTFEPVVSALADCKIKEQEIKQADKKHIFFHNISINELDLSNSQIDPQKANLQGILSADIKVLNLSQNKLGTLKVGVVLLAPLISNICTSLEMLDLSSNLLTKETLETLLTQRYQFLHTLILSNNKIGDKGCPLITNFISSCTSLVRVDIANIGIKDEGLDSLCTGIKMSNSLQALDMSGNIFSAKGMSQLAKALQSTRSLSRLLMQDCKLNPDAGKIIGESLKTNTSLTSLDCRKNSFGRASYQAFAQALKDGKKLTYLNLDGNPIEGSFGTVCESLCTNKSLTSLSLRNADLGRGEVCLGDVMRKNSSLMNLDIAHNNFGVKYVEDLSEGIGENTSLIYLNLCGNPITDEGIQYIVKALNYNEGVVSLNLDSVQITDAGLHQLAEMLQTNETLKTLLIQNNNITEAGFMDFLTTISQKQEQVLKKVDFTGNKIKPESRDKIISKCIEVGLSQLTVIL